MASDSWVGILENTLCAQAGLQMGPFEADWLLTRRITLGLARSLPLVGS